MKKTFVSIAVIIALTSALSSSAFAHGGNHRSGNTPKTSKIHSTCSVKNCTASGLHNHSGKTYAAHHSGDGHSYHSNVHTESDGHRNHASEGSNHH